MAGLLDALFDPSLYNGPGGLLSRLQPMVGQIQPSPGFEPTRPPAQPGDAAPVDVGNYRMPRLGNADLFNPQQVNTPQNAQPAQGQIPTVQPQQQMPAFGQQRPAGFFDRLNSGLQSIGNGGSVIGALTGNHTDPRAIAQQDQRALFDAYKSAGLTPSQATLAVLNPKLAENMLGTGGTDDIKEYQFAKRENPGLTFEKFMAQKKSVSGEYGLQGIWGVKNGKPAIMQLGKSGAAIESKLPEGFEPAQKPIEIDAGTHKILIDPQTRQPIAQIPKNVAAKEAEEKVGQARGTAQAALANGADLDAEATKKKIDAFIDHKGFNEVFGQIDQYRPSWTHSNEGADALARYKQLKGTAFLSAYAMLKGGGAITDIEGQKAGDAMARLDRAQSEDEAKQALRDFKDAVDLGLQKLRRAAGGGESAAAAPKRIRLNADGTIAQ